MTTYNTYQEAKIAMPLACIIHNTEDDIFFGMPSREGTTLNDDGCKFAEPQDYCMTVEKFLADGHKFIEGDIVFDAGRVSVINGSFEVEVYNKPDLHDGVIYILRAAALENQMNIDNLATQTPEEKEALDNLPGIPRDHLLKMIKLQTETIKELSEELNSSESPNGSNDIAKPLWSNGDECIYQGKEWQFVSILSEHFHSTAVLFDVDTEELKQVPVDSLSKPETPQQREERERLEAAYDLYFEWMLDGKTSTEQIKTLEDFLDDKDDVSDWLRIVDKTNYRKESN